MKKSSLKKQLTKLRAQLRRKPKAVAAAAAPPRLTLVGGTRSPGIRNDVLMRARVKKKRSLDAADSTIEAQRRVFQPYAPPPGVLPPGVKAIAMDAAATNQAISWAQSSLGVFWSEGLTFPGYAYLSELTLRPEYRVISQVIATEMTRKWITFEAVTENKEEGEGEGEGLEGLEGGEPDPGEAITSQEQTEAGEEGGEEQPDEAAEPDVKDEPARDDALTDGLLAMHQAKQDKKDQQEEEQSALREERVAKMTEGDDKYDRIQELNDEMDRLQVRDVFYKIAEHDGWFGRSHLYIDTGNTDEPDELITPLTDDEGDYTTTKIGKGDIKRLAVVEPVWVYPQNYNSTDPLKPEWYNPEVWFVMGKQVHTSRLLTFVGRPVPDILKPAYAFGGLSLSQICKPYIDNWLQTRQSVNDIIHAFSTMVLLTDLSSVMTPSSGGMPGEGSDLYQRLDLFNQFRDNRGVFALDKTSEDFKNVSAPLGTLDKLQAQAQEHMSSVARIPLVKLLGISPAGLNASSEGELKTFYDTIASYQEQFFRPNLTKVVHMIMLNLWGEIDEDISIKFEELWALDEKELAEVEKLRAEADDILVNGAAALHPEEVRKRIASDPGSQYQDIDIADVPDPPEADTGSLGIQGHMPFGKGAQGGEGGGEGGGGGLFGAAAAAGKSPGDFPGKEPGGDAVIPFGGANDAEWNESDHPRVKGGANAGEFTSGSGGSSSGSSEHPGSPGQPGGVKPIPSATGGQYAGMYETKGSTPLENHALTANKVLNKPAQKGIHYRRLLAALIKEAPKFGNSTSIPQLQAKLTEALDMTAKSLLAKGKVAEANKVVQTLVKLKAPEDVVVPLEAWVAEKWEQKDKGTAKIGAPVPAGAPAAPAKPPAATKPPPTTTITSAELEKAKKPSEYYPPPASEAGKAIVKPFNDKYAGKSLTEPEDLYEKVSAYKDVTAKLQALSETEKAATAAQQKEAAAKAKAEQAEQAKKSAEANKAMMADLGINEQEAVGFGALATMMGGNKKDFVDKFKGYEKQAAQYGYPISGFQGALIENYSDGGYRHINNALRQGSWTEAQHVYVKLVNKALQKMPRYEGTVRRGVDLPSGEQGKYTVGNIVEERAFTSTSITKPWSGNTNFVIKAIGQRAAHIKKLSAHSSEDEVLYSARTFFKVTKVEGKPGSKMTVHMEEMEHPDA